MKKLLSLVMGIAIAATASVSHGDVLAFDNFDYADGALVGNGGWANHSGTADSLLVSGGQVTAVENGSVSEDANLGFTGVAGDIYYGVDFSVDDLGTPYVGTDNEYFMHFKTGGFDFSARLDIVAAQGLGDFSVGIASDESTADTIWGTDLTFGTTYRAVVKYDQVSNIAQLWIDATLETDTSILGEDRADPGDSVIQIGIRQSNSDGDETVRLDGLVVGESFADVVVAVTAVPEPGMLAFLSVGLVGLVARRRRS